MAIEPKSPRKRAVKKSKSKETSPEVAEVATSEAEATPKTRKKAAAIPVPIFQAAPVDAVAPKRAKKDAAKSAIKDSEKSEGAEETTSSADSEDSDSRGGRNRRRRRGGRGRRKPQGEGADSQEGSDDESQDPTENSEEGSEGTTHRRRRRRRASGDDVTPGEVIDEDGVVTVVKVREVREKSERPVRDRSERGMTLANTASHIVAAEPSSQMENS
jgi:hypothetical protein